jgi:long-subunit fatty acid transport protein
MTSFTMNFRQSCLIASFLLISSLAVAQEDSTRASRRATKEDRPPSAFWQRARFGGNFALQLGNLNTFVDISPTLTYIVNEKVQLGGGVSFMYVRFNAFNPFTGQRVRQPGNTIYGGRVFTRFFPISALPQIFLQGELETLNVAYPEYNIGTGNFDRVRGFVPGAFVGGGFFQGVGNRSGFTLTVLYNLLYDQYRLQSPYPSPLVVRAGFQL